MSVALKLERHFVGGIGRLGILVNGGGEASPNGQESNLDS